MKYTIFVDLDGSLLNRKGQVSPKTKEYINKITALGHQVIITTGRPFIGAIDIYNTLELKTPIITDNGAFISNPSNKDFLKLGCQCYLKIHINYLN